MTRTLEWNLQTKVKQFVRECVIEKHEFFSFDKAGVKSDYARMREAGRGIRSGTPDSLLIVNYIAPIWTELKTGSGKPSEAQLDIGHRLMLVGHHWFWTNSVESYGAHLSRYGVKLHTGWNDVARASDRVLQAAVDKPGPKRDASHPPVVRARKRGSLTAKEQSFLKTYYGNR